ncbi:hypothetical protein BCL69_106517 [Nitrosomonas communis]|uniref:Uncharacterized protein n=1 Tax=Nitrosomonas communis TaxID=44574 RepID=A0A0F7KJ84_9PROT|nr:hypothetical protein AAW31_17355 [Nitrosomonas communis]TYP80015.1 hypothetical protein BCL69_106517 [Nitrosomonas communis]
MRSKIYFKILNKHLFYKKKIQSLRCILKGSSVPSEKLPQLQLYSMTAFYIAELKTGDLYIISVSNGRLV